jgi:hypothetical protein
VRPCFRTQVRAVVLASEPARWEAPRRRSIRLARAHRLRGAAASAAAPNSAMGVRLEPHSQPFGVPKARRRYTNLIVWLPPHVRPVAERYLAAASIASRCRRLRCLRLRRLRRLRCLRRLRLRRHRRTLLPPLADAPPAPTSCQPPQRSPPVDAPPLLTHPHRPARCHRVAALCFPCAVSCGRASV